MPNITDIETLLRSIAVRYPAELVSEQLADVKRIAFHIGLVIVEQGSDITICDIGGGIGLFSIGCAALGMRSILVDDFRDRVNDLAFGTAALDLHRSYGVEVMARDVIAEQRLDLPTAVLDVATTFDSMEHWHHSPKRLFTSARDALRPGGLFVLGVPNCVNLRKRLTVPLGIGRWSPMEVWYEQEVFRGHVREPDIDDLRYIARDMELTDVHIFGRNWMGRASQSTAKRRMTMVADRTLQRLPSLCSDIYMTGRKPNNC
jgi:SAM-dependent methyltransferase